MVKAVKKDRQDSTTVDTNLAVYEDGDKFVMEVDLNEVINITQRGHEKIVDANWITVQEDNDYKWVLKMILIRKKAKK